MPDRAPDPTAARIEAALSDSIRAGEMGEGITAGMMGSWAIVGVYTDQDGKRRHIMLTADRQPLHETLGLIRAGDIIWSEGMRRWIADISDGDS